MKRYRIRPTIAGYAIEQRVYWIFWVPFFTSYDKPLIFNDLLAARRWVANPTPV